jgi:sugar phosphate isomerase/epimerase
VQLAAQLYTVRQLTTTAEGFEECLRRCSEIGYAGVQVSAVGSMTGPEPTVTAVQAREWLDRYNLSCCATHVAWNRLTTEFDKVVTEHKILGCTYIALGSLGSDFGPAPENYRRFLEEAEPVARALKEQGIRFGYHNHSHEFIRDPETGRPAIDLLVGNGVDWLDLEVDTYWVAHAGASPATFLKRATGRLWAVHLKDMEVVAGDGPVMAPVGEGNLDWPEILDACQTGGTEWLIVEQDTCRRDPFDCLASSYRFLSASIA